MTEYLEKTQEVQNQLCRVAADLVFLCQDDEDKLEEMLRKSIFDGEEYKLLPKFRQTFIVGFIAGRRHNGSGVSQTLPAIGKQVPEKEVPPKSVRDLQPGVTWKRHINGGGWVSETAYVEATAVLGSKAVVFGTARVFEKAKIYGCAQVKDDAEVRGAAHVHGFAIVAGRAQVFDAARVLGRVVLTGDVQVGGMSLVRGNQVLDRGEIVDERLAPKISSIQELKPGVHRRSKSG